MIIDDTRVTRLTWGHVFDTEFDRQRRQPQLCDPLYIHLADLRLALQECLRGLAIGRWLDYGSGTSPYREILGEAGVLRADIAGGGATDIDLIPGAACPVEAEEFDGILSTQVLEHVPDPAFYLKDCMRLLRPGGHLIVTTHGIWEEHGCPYDFHRWTLDGLTMEVSNAGFDIIRTAKLSTGLRGLLQLMLQQRTLFYWHRRYCWGLAFRLFGWLIHTLRGSIARFADRALEDQKVVWGSDPASVYLGVLVVARKPVL